MTVLIACDTIITRVQGSAGRHVAKSVGLEPEINTVCRASRARHGRPASVALPRYGHSGTNVAFCTLFNGSGKNHLAYAAYFGPLLLHSNLRRSILDRFRQHVQIMGFLYPGKLAIGA